jgi:prephenate dehydratase
LFAAERKNGEFVPKTNGGKCNGVSRRVGYQGVQGAYSEVAAATMEKDACLVPCETLPVVFARVASGELDAGVVAVENSLAGSVGETYDLLLYHDLTVTGEATISIDHCLLVSRGTKLTQVKRAMSHPQALAQCSDYLHSHGIVPVSHYNTAGAAKFLQESPSQNTAVIASARSAELYGLEILERSIQSRRDNFTRFYRIEPSSRPAGAKNKSVFAISLAHHPGSLFLGLASFACRGLNLTKIESRPIRRDPWEYVFFLEIQGHVDDWQVKDALNELKAKTSMLKVLGSFAVEE